MIVFNPNPDIPKPWQWCEIGQRGDLVSHGHYATRAEARRAIHLGWMRAHWVPGPAIHTPAELQALGLGSA